MGAAARCKGPGGALALPAAAGLLAMALLGGCAARLERRHVDPEQLAQLQPVQLTVGVGQQSLMVRFDATDGTRRAATATCGMLGLVGAVACGAAVGPVAARADAHADALRADQANARLRPLRMALVGLNVSQALRQSIADAMGRVPGLQLVGPALVQDKALATEPHDDAAGMAPGAMLYVDAEYYLTADLSTLEIRSSSRLVAHRTQAGAPAGPLTPPRGGAEPAYRVDLVYRATLPQRQKQPEANLRAWQDNGAWLLHSALHEGVRQTGRLLANDLQTMQAAPPEETEERAGTLSRGRDGMLEYDADLTRLGMAAATGDTQRP